MPAIIYKKERYEMTGVIGVREMCLMCYAHHTTDYIPQKFVT